MASLKPPWFTRTVVNKIAMATGIGDSETLTPIEAPENPDDRHSSP